MSKREFKKIGDGEVALAKRDALVTQLTAALPEARVIKRVLDDHTSRAITFALLSKDSRSR